MKILFLAAAHSIHTIKWVNALAIRNNEVYLVFNRGHEPAENKCDERVNLFCLKNGGPSAYFLNALELRKIVKKINPDVINAHYASGYGTLARMAKVAPLVLSVWGSDVYDFPYHSWLNKNIVKNNLTYAQVISSTSVCMGQQINKLMGYNLSKIEITPFGIDTSLFNPKLFEKKGDDPITIGIIKSLKKVYRIDLFIISIKLLIKKLNDKGDIKTAKKIRAEIYGKGDQEEILKKIVDENNLCDIVQFKGQVANEQVPEALSKFDIFCATSDKESFGVAILEAMSMELPVVVTDAEGYKEIVANEETGIIARKNEPESISEALLELVCNEKIRRKYGKNARKRVLELYDWDDCVERMEKIYHENRRKRDE